MKNKIIRLRHYLTRFVSILAGDERREMRRLEDVMKLCHREESNAVVRAWEAMECGSPERCKMWLAVREEARTRCNEEFRKPMIELTGKPDMFDEKESEEEAQITSQRKLQFDLTQNQNRNDT